MPLRPATILPRARLSHEGRPVRTIAALLLLAPAMLAAQATPVREPPCTPQGSAMCTGVTLATTLASLDRRLDRRHAALVPLVRGDTAAGDEDVRITMAVDTLHATWRRLRDDDCELHGALTRAGGSWPSVWAVDCAIAATRARITTVDAAIRCIEKLPADQRRFERFTCLERLRVLRASTRNAGPG